MKQQKPKCSGCGNLILKGAFMSYRDRKRAARRKICHLCLNDYRRKKIYDTTM